MMNRKVKIGLLVLVPALLVGLVALVGAVTLQVYQAIHPERILEPPGEMVAAVLPLEDVTFDSIDGVELSGWLMTGPEGGPAVILCHDAGASRAAVIHLAAPLLKAGFTVLAFDFRGHGSSGGSFTSFGIKERFDVQGAVRFLSEPGEEERPAYGGIGIYGVGMGAHAAVLGVESADQVQVMVLDALYPNPAWRLERELFGDWRIGREWLGPLARTSFSLLQKTEIGEFHAADRLPLLTGVDILLVAPAGDSRLAAEVQAMYETIPEQVDQDGNLVTLPSMANGTLSADKMKVFQSGVVSFLVTRMLASKE